MSDEPLKADDEESIEELGDDAEDDGFEIDETEPEETEPDAGP